MNEKLCEIAYICGAMQNELNNEVKNYDLQEMYENVYELIYTKWINREDIKDVEEEGYISAYAQRVIKEQFCK